MPFAARIPRLDRLPVTNTAAIVVTTFIPHQGHARFLLPFIEPFGLDIDIYGSLRLGPSLRLVRIPECGHSNGRVGYEQAYRGADGNLPEAHDLRVVHWSSRMRRIPHDTDRNREAASRRALALLRRRDKTGEAARSERLSPKRPPRMRRDAPDAAGQRLPRCPQC